jgi:hypothetical protein
MTKAILWIAVLLLAWTLVRNVDIHIDVFWLTVLAILVLVVRMLISSEEEITPPVGEPRWKTALLWPVRVIGMKFERLWRKISKPARAQADEDNKGYKQADGEHPYPHSKI